MSRFADVRPLGVGKPGVVRLASDRARGGRTVLLKTGPSDELDREFAILSTVRHPGLPVALDRTELDGVPVLVREWVPGDSLEDRARAAPLSHEELSSLAVTVLAALDRLHAEGFLHLDVKPDNVVVHGAGPRFRCVLVDAGFALDRAAAATAGQGGGTPAFAAPEVRAGRPLDRRADLFSLGRTLRAVASGEVAEDLVRLFDRLDADAPEQRFGSAAEALASPALGPSAAVVRRRLSVPLPWVRRPAFEDGIAARLEREGVVELVGSSGSGRTALLERLYAAYRRRGRGVYLVRGGAEEDAAAQLAAALGVDLPSPTTEAGPRLDDGESASFRGTLRALAPVSGDAMILVDDADALEADVLRALCTAARGREVETGGLLLATSRSLDMEIASVPLPPIGAAELAAALDRLTSERVDPSLRRAAADKVCAARNGLARGIADAFAGAARRSLSGREQLRSIAEGSIPVARRLGRSVLERLDEKERDVVDLLAVAGESVGAGRLRPLVADAGVITTLVDGGLVIQHIDGSLELHPRLGPTLMDSMAIGRRRELAARWAAVSDSPLRELHAFVADPGPTTDRALATLLEMGRESGAPRRAVALARRARRASEAAAPHARVVMARGMIDLGHGKEAEAELDEVARSAGERGPLAALVALGAAEAAHARGAFDEASALARRAAAANDEVATRSRALNLEGVALYRDGRYQEVLERARAPLSGEGEIERSLRANLIGIASLRLGRHDEAARALDEALVGFERAGNPSGVSMVRNNLALVESRAGHPARSVRQLLRLRRQARSSNSPLRQALASNNAALILRDAGRLGRASALLDEAVRIRRAAGDRYGLGASLSNRATVLAELGEAAPALRDIDESLRAFRTAGARAKVVVVLKNRVRVLVALGDDVEAERASAEALERARASGEAIEEGDVLRLDALRRARSGDVLGAAEALEEAIRVHHEIGDANRETEARIERALLARAVPLDDDRRSELEASLRTRRRDYSSRERDGMLAVGIAALDPADASALIERSFERLSTSARPRWRLLAAAAAAELAHGAGRELALVRALAVGTDALARLERGAPGLVDARSADLIRELARGRDDEEVGRLADPARRGGVAFGDLHAILELYHRLADSNEVESLLDAILDAAIELVGAARAFLLVREDDAAVVLRSRAADGDALSEPDDQYSRSILETVLDAGRPVVLGDAARDSRWSEHVSVRRLRLRSVACVPLRVRGATTGALYVDQSGRSRAFDPDRLELLERFADQASLALERVRSEARIQRLNDELEAKLARVERVLDAERRSGRLTEALRPVLRFAGLHPTVARVRRELERAALTDLTVLLVGETGTGKGLAARCLHDASPRAGGPFITLDGAAIPETLFEAEVFGVEDGAFTGAVNRPGLAVEADGGTLFLDDVDALSPEAQVKLLRFLESGEVRPVGGATRRVDVRIVAATGEELRSRAADGRFRDDLFWRLKGLELTLPPLRERGDDVLLLAEQFLVEHGAVETSIKPLARQRLLRHPWPGNVRELMNEMRRLAVRVGGGPIGESQLGPSIRGAEGASGGDEMQLDASGARELQRQTEADLVRRALAQTDGNRSQAARILGMSRYGFLKKLRRLGIEEAD